MRWTFLCSLAVSAMMLMAGCGEDVPTDGVTADDSIVGPDGTWTVTMYDDGSGLALPIAGSEITAELDEGRVSGSAGCNTYSGSYQVDGAAMSIGPLAQTERACLSPDGVMEQELRFLEALQSTATWVVSDETDDGLELLGPDGGPVVVLERA